MEAQELAGSNLSSPVDHDSPTSKDTKIPLETTRGTISLQKDESSSSKHHPSSTNSIQVPIPFLRRNLVTIHKYAKDGATRPRTRREFKKEEGTDYGLIFNVFCQDNYGRVLDQGETRFDRRCPFCLFDAGKNNDFDLAIHCHRFHSDHHKFDIEKTQDGSFHITARPYNLIDKYPIQGNQIRDMIFVRCETFSRGIRRKNRQELYGQSKNQRKKYSAASKGRKRARFLPSMLGVDEFIASDVKPSKKSKKPKRPLRQYYRCKTRLPMADGHWEIDSDVESDDDDWLDDLAQASLNEFVDVTAKEKSFLNLWKRFMRTTTVFGDDTIPDRCLEFVRSHALELQDKGLRQELLMHLITVWDYGLHSSDHLLKCMREYDEINK